MKILNIEGNKIELQNYFIVIDLGMSRVSILDKKTDCVFLPFEYDLEAAFNRIEELEK